MRQHKQPCRECPWKKTSAQGWLGSATPVEFLQQSENEVRMPCHLHVNYESPDWQQQADQSPQCAGRAIHFANRMKVARNKSLLVLKPDRETIFTNPQDFIDHHCSGSGPKVRMIGCVVLTD